jgi:ABC-2 type transport system ATP-binding protein
VSRSPAGQALHGSNGAPVVRAEAVTKLYGRHTGVAELDFEVIAGEVFGFLGPNGAGKTTTIRLMLDLIRPTSGCIKLFGLDTLADSVAIRRRVGYVPGDLRLYGRLSGRDLLSYLAHLRGLRDLAHAEQLAGRLDLDLDRPIQALSKGNRQKVGLVQAFMHEPDLLVLDEPTAGLDPLVQQVFYDLVQETTADGRTVFLSSHVLSEVQHVADRVALVREGRLVLVEEMETLRERAATRVEATFAAAPPPEAFSGIDGVVEVERHGATVVFSLRGPADGLVKALAGYRVLGLDSHEAELEDIFLTLYRGEGDRAA